MLNMKYCRTENVIAALREWEDDPGTDEHLHHELYELCSRIAADAGLVPDMPPNRLIDAKRWRHARKLLTIDDIEGAQGAFDSFGGLVSEHECLRADAAIDAAMKGANA